MEAILWEDVLGRLSYVKLCFEGYPPLQSRMSTQACMWQSQKAIGCGRQLSD